MAQSTTACGATPYECAVTHVERNEFAAAVDLLEALVQKEPVNLKALNLLGIALTGAGRNAAAEARFREALRIDPGFYAALKNLAINEFNRGTVTLAQQHFEQVLKHAPDDEVTHIHLGEIDFGRKRFREALAHYEKGGARVAHNPEWRLHYSTCLFEAGLAAGRAGAYAEAATLFGKARAGYGDPYVAEYNQVLMLVEGGRHDEAIAAAEEMIAGGTQRGELYNLASRAYYKAGRIKDAYDALRTAARLEPDIEEHYIDLAMMCLDLENHDLGLEIIDVGLHYRPSSFMLYLQRGVLLAMKARLGEAEKEFEHARRLAPDRPAPYAALAMIWMQTGQTPRAVETLRKEARDRRADHVISYTFAVALVRSGVDPAGPEAIEAIDALRASIRANGEFAPARSQLGRLLLKRNDLDGAIRELEKAVALDPDGTAALYNLAQAYNRKGDRSKASQLLAKVSALNAQERGDDPDGELKRTVVRIVREGVTIKPGGTP